MSVAAGRESGGAILDEGQRHGRVTSTVWERPAHVTRVEAATRATPVRGRLLALSLTADVIAALLSYEIALIGFNWLHHSTVGLLAASFDWGMALGLTAILVTYVWVGLYKLEAYVERSFHLARVARGSVIALVVTAFVAFALKSPLVTESRLTIFLGFLLFFVLDAAVRVGWLDRLYRADVTARPGPTVMVGWVADGGVLHSRLGSCVGSPRYGCSSPRTGAATATMPNPN